MTTRVGGYGAGAFGALNLAFHVGDDNRTVEKNRNLVERALGLPAHPHWLNQVHGTDCLRMDRNSPVPRQGDAAWTNRDGVVLAVMVADCLPILITSRDGEEIAVVHAGWKGLAAGVIEAAIGEFHGNNLMAWMGPAIGHCHYEVDDTVKDAFKDDTGFGPGRDADHWMLDLYAVAGKRLAGAGITAVYGGGFCTCCDSERFFSYRRDGATGRMAALIWKSDVIP